MPYLPEILVHFELHSPEGIRDCFAKDVNPNAVVRCKPLIYELINMYTRSPRFKECIQCFIDHGVVFDNDPELLSVLSDNAALLDAQLSTHQEAVTKKYSLDCAFTPLYEATLLHICAEYNHVACAKVLVQHGADINAKAGLDSNGFGGHTPIFHTVNQHNNQSLDMLQYLLAQKADLDITVKGLIWGTGYKWETFIPAVNPASYAMMGLLRQFQRTEPQIYEVVNLLLAAQHGTGYYPFNVPNKYLHS